MNPYLYVAIGAVSILVIILSIHYGTKKCCGSSFRLPRETYLGSYYYAAPGSDEADARMWQQFYLPPASDIAEEGGSLEQVAGLEAARPLTYDPWTDKRSFLGPR